MNVLLLFYPLGFEFIFIFHSPGAPVFGKIVLGKLVSGRLVFGRLVSGRLVRRRGSFPYTQLTLHLVAASYLSFQKFQKTFAQPITTFHQRT